MSDIDNPIPNDLNGANIVSPSALEALQRAEVDVAIATAHRFPRDIALSVRHAEVMACRNQKIAEKMHYAVPKGGKTRVGPSIGFAKVLIQAWRNSTAIARVIGADQHNVHLQGVCHDLESNVRIGFEMDWPVQAPKDLESEGVEARWKFQIDNAKRAGRSVALRDAIFAVVPVTLFDEVLEKAKLVALGTGASFEEKRNNAISACKAKKISQPMIYKALGVAGLESITADDLIWLKSALQNIEDGLDTVESLFGPPDTVKAQVPKRKGATTKEPEQAPNTPITANAGTPPPGSGGADQASSTKAEPQNLFPKTDEEELREELLSKLRQAGLEFREFAQWLEAIGAVGSAPEKVAELRVTLLSQAVNNWEANLTALRTWKEAPAQS